MKNKEFKPVSLKSIQKLFFRTQLVLIISLALILGIAGSLINLHYETEKRDQNLQNVAQTIANSPLLTNNSLVKDNESLSEYLDALKETLSDIDVISVVDDNGMRVYHSNPSLIGTQYDGNLPNFSNRNDDFYTVDENGPSGSQRRAYAAVYDRDGNYIGVVMAIMLMKNIHTETIQMLWIFFAITLVAIGIEIFLAFRLSGKVKDGLMGYEPDVFTAMYRMRDNILESLEEGILATDEKGVIQFANTAATNMLCTANQGSLVGKTIASLGDEILTETMSSQEKELNVTLSDPNIILNSITINNADGTTGAIGILHNRAEYTKLMEDLSGTRYLVDSMRANNHDFTNKLHVILGLIQMEMYDEATSYIQNITMVQRENISKVMNAVNEPAVAALLIGKIARAAELNVHFVLREGCTYSASDMSLPSEMLVTVIGNLLDNAYDSMNDSDNPNEHKELMFGIYSRPGAVLITVDDTGSGIAKENLENIFTKGFSTKGEGRGTCLDQIRTMIESFGGTISVESQEGIGTSFSVSFTKE